MLSLDVHRIGVVRRTDDERSVLELLPAYAEGLDGLDPGRRVQVLFWMHRLSRADRRALRVHPRGDASLMRRGVFSLRSPMRPNPIGVTEATVLEVRGSSVVVEGLDALDGSPIIDIKAACR